MRRLVTVFLAATSAITASDVYELQFRSYLSRHGIVFGSEKDFSSRLTIFKDNLLMIESLKAEMQQTGLKLGETPFLHLNQEEFRSYVRGGSAERSKVEIYDQLTKKLQSRTIVRADYNLPSSVDWTAVGAVTPVKNQGLCGGCWAFSVTGAIESAYYIKHGNFPGSVDPSNGFTGLSEQQLLSCNPLSFGCGGGWTTSGFVYAAQNGGLTGEGQYPFLEIDKTTTSGDPCKSGEMPIDSQTSTVAGDPFVLVNPTVEDFMIAVAQQPVSIEIAASSFIFQTYTGGVIQSHPNRLLQCGDALDHAVLLVGYGTLNGIDYWKVKNSWNYTWGMDGYVLIERSALNVCGLVSLGTYPNLVSPVDAPTPSPTSIPVVKTPSETTTISTVLGMNEVITLPGTGPNAYSVVLTDVGLGGLAIGGVNAVASLPCRNTYMNPAAEAALWTIGTLYDDSTFVANLGIAYINPYDSSNLFGWIAYQFYYYFISRDSSAFIDMNPFKVPEYNLPLSCNTLNTYWCTDYTGDVFLDTLMIGQSATDHGLAVTRLTYYVDPDALLLTSGASAQTVQVPDHILKAERERLNNFLTQWLGFIAALCVVVGMFAYYRLKAERQPRFQYTAVHVEAGLEMNRRVANTDVGSYQQIDL